jgi:hypothetical protein
MRRGAMSAVRQWVLAGVGLLLGLLEAREVYA